MDNNQDQSPLSLDENMTFRQKEFNDSSIPQQMEQIILAKRAVRKLEEELFDRLKTENEIRKLKRACRRCPFESYGMCTNIFIRCGERQQYAVPESVTERRLAHLCNYHPAVSKQEFRVLVVDDDPMVCELCVDLMKALGLKAENVVRAGNVAEAEARLKEAKIRNQVVHVVLIDLRMPGPSGFHLVNHMVERNFNSRILLMSGYAETAEKPFNYMGQAEIIPGHFVVKHFLKKPIPFAEISRQMREIELEYCG